MSHVATLHAIRFTASQEENILQVSSGVPAKWMCLRGSQLTKKVKDYYYHGDNNELLHFLHRAAAAATTTSSRM